MTDTQRLHGGGADVSRETLERLKIFESLVEKWNPKINLVSRRSLNDLWNRHILDSIQVFKVAERSGDWVDIGSGGGFPGLVVAILAKEKAPDQRVTLIESDQRKCVFLRTVARETGVLCRVLSERIEQVEPQKASVLSARALADLSSLLEFAERHLDKTGTALFPKGATWKKEVEDARKSWHFDVNPISSVTEEGSVVLRITGVSRV
ncbi:16S rRNA (guanine(527)-N(7))-methyltransferase RsmG [Rhodobacteraceae bacterium F11138]|nr:16S rRNA (guanine(527)-N(7))-methyltransferase RsmG [Rhodobacteraceae bacterium F11138]